LWNSGSITEKVKSPTDANAVDSNLQTLHNSTMIVASSSILFFILIFN